MGCTNDVYFTSYCSSYVGYGAKCYPSGLSSTSIAHIAPNTDVYINGGSAYLSYSSPTGFSTSSSSSTNNTISIGAIIAIVVVSIVVVVCIPYFLLYLYKKGKTQAPIVSLDTVSVAQAPIVSLDTVSVESPRDVAERERAQSLRGRQTKAERESFENYRRESCALKKGLTIPLMAAYVHFSTTQLAEELTKGTREVEEMERLTLIKKSIDETFTTLSFNDFIPGRYQICIDRYEWLVNAISEHYERLVQIENFEAAIKCNKILIELGQLDFKTSDEINDSSQIIGLQIISDEYDL